MGGFQHFDVLACRAIAVAGDDGALQRASPKPFERLRHLRRALAGTDDDGAALRRGRKVRRKAGFRICGPDGRVKQAFQKASCLACRFHAAHSPVGSKGSIVEFARDAKGTKVEGRFLQYRVRTNTGSEHPER